MPKWKVDAVHTVLVTVHAVAAVLAAAAGGLALVRPRWGESYLVALAVSGLALVGLAVLSPSPRLRVVDLALLVLFAVAVVRAVRAAGVVPADRRRSQRFVGGVGFGLIALADGFLVVAALDLGAPVWSLPVVGVGVAVVGHLWLSRLLGRRAVDDGEPWVQRIRPPSRVGREV